MLKFSCVALQQTAYFSLPSLNLLQNDHVQCYDAMIIFEIVTNVNQLQFNKTFFIRSYLVSSSNYDITFL